ncbi:MAG: hypothetical protein JXB49_34750, partial [Bacteroidales bacterium]|nr:hypothetical protein [Bacteroidales bacterium]
YKRQSSAQVKASWMFHLTIKNKLLTDEKNCLIFSIIVVLFSTSFVSCKKNDDDNNDDDDNVAKLIEGTYNEEGHYYRYIKIVDDGATIEYYTVADELNTHCDYENRGLLTSNPSTGFTISDNWYKFIPLDTWCGSAYWVAHQEDENTILIRYGDNYEDAYELGKSHTFTKQ